MISPLDIGLPSKFPEFRSYPGFSQWETASSIASSSHRFIGICAPPGAGKTVINITSSRILDSTRTLYLTVTKSLQNQLMGDFADSEINLFNLIGHSSYPCASKVYSSFGDLESLECEDRSSCLYWPDVRTSLSRSHVTSNYANWVTIAKIGDPERFGKFDLLILDEAHNLEALLCGLLAVRISRRTVQELIRRSTPSADDSVETWIDWAEICYPVCEKELYLSEREDEENGGKTSLRTKQLRRLSENLLTISNISDTWVVEPTQYGSQLTPAFAENYAEKYLFRGIPKVIFSSATLTGQDLIYLGLESREFEIFDVESGFEPKRGPFIYWPTVEIDYNTMKIEGCIRQAVNRVDKILTVNSNTKQLIHSVSYEYAEMIKRYSHLDLISHTSKTREEVLNRWMRSNTPSTLVSPTLQEGVDLADDLCRNQIIWKVPTRYSQDPLIAARKKRDKNYTNYLSGKSILQMWGRVRRSFRDYGSTFILDKHWGNWMSSSIEWPKYFRRAWQVVRDVPDPLKF